MKGRQSYVPGVGLVTYVPGGGYKTLPLGPDGSLSVTEKAAKRVTREYGCPIPRADTPNRLQRVTKILRDHGFLTLIALLIYCLAVDAATLWVITWWLNR